MLEVVQITNRNKEHDSVGSVVLGQNGAINHCCFEVANLEASIIEFERNGAKIIEGCPTHGAYGKIAFFIQKQLKEF